MKRDAARGVDMIELRLDGVADIDVGGALEGRRLPVIVTCRPRWEGGRFDGSEEERRRLLAQAVEAGADYLDVEWRAGWTDLVDHRGRTQLVLSIHDFQGVPPDLRTLYRSMRQAGADVVKIAVTATRLCDTFAFPAPPAPSDPPIVGPSNARTSGSSDLVFIAMGPSGLASRILAGRLGSRWTYAGSEAPGQMSAQMLLGDFRVRDIGPSSALYGVVGNRASGSLSPSIHNAAFVRAGLDAVYLPLETPEFDDFLAFAERAPLAGASVTMPFKEIAMRCDAVRCDELSRSVGAVNTLRRDGETWSATNTDVDGFLDPIRSLKLQDRRVAVLGAGGVARAVAVAVARAGATVTVFSRRHERAREVAALVGGAACEGLPGRGTWDLLVNATPVGMAPGVDETPIPAERLVGCGTVYDLVYEPRETRLIREARASGCATIGGFQMLVAQARRQRQFWKMSQVHSQRPEVHAT